MIARCLLVVVAGLLVAADAKEDAAKEDLKKLEGKWNLVAVEELGKKGTEEEVKEENMWFTFAGNKLTLKLGKTEKPVEGTFSITPSEKPKQIDMKVEEWTIRGIYELDGDTLKLCLVREAKKDRPTDFTTKKDDGRGLFVLKRDKK